MKKALLLLFFAAAAISMIAMSTHYFLSDATGIMKNKEVASMLWYRCMLRVHIAFGIVAIVTGPIQFIKRIRLSYPGLHRKIGYTYTGSLLTSALAALVIVPWSMGGMIAALGFSVLAICWIVLTSGSIVAVIKGDIRSHRFLMILSYSLTVAAIPQRTMLLTAFIPGMDFMTIYRFSAWFPWMFSLGLAYIIYKPNPSLTTNTL